MSVSNPKLGIGTQKSNVTIPHVKFKNILAWQYYHAYSFLIRSPEKEPKTQMRQLTNFSLISAYDSSSTDSGNETSKPKATTDNPSEDSSRINPARIGMGFQSDASNNSSGSCSAGKEPPCKQAAVMKISAGNSKSVQRVESAPSAPEHQRKHKTVAVVRF